MLTDLRTALRPSLTFTAGFALLLGVAYPLALTGIGQTLFPHQANGSLIVDHGKVVGSELIGQGFASDRYFHGRPSAAGSSGYDSTASSGSNLGPTSKVLVDRVKGDVAKLSAEAPGTPVPADLATASGSGLDPDISPEAAFFQADRVAKVRHLSVDRVRQLIQAHVEQPMPAFLGDAHVNVLELNRALDVEAPKA
jgi:potassium-transporting ATPase KdpC subunit